VTHLCQNTSGEPSGNRAHIATLGYPQQLFFFANSESNPSDQWRKGIVLIIVQTSIQRIEQDVTSNVYGVVGGLHYPVTALPCDSGKTDLG
jgi:hypothetical protein